jgi:periplasmic divalent cation tolerance protein
MRVWEFRHLIHLGNEEFMLISVVTTVDNKEALDLIGKTLLEKKLVACMQIAGPIESTYWWKGTLEKAQEWMGVMKTTSELYESVEKTIRMLHPYDVPEIMAFEAKYVYPAYYDWVVGETSMKIES